MLAPPSAWLSALLCPEHWLNVKDMYRLEPCCSFLYVYVYMYFLDFCVLIMGTAAFPESSVHNKNLMEPGLCASA